MAFLSDELAAMRSNPKLLEHQREIIKAFFRAGEPGVMADSHAIDAMSYLTKTTVKESSDATVALRNGSEMIFPRRFGKSSMSLAETFRSIEEKMEEKPSSFEVTYSGRPGVSITIDDLAGLGLAQDELMRGMVRKMVVEPITKWLESDTTVRRCQGCKFFKAKPGSSMDGKCGNIQGTRASQPVRRTEGCGRNLTDEELREKVTVAEREAFRNGTQQDGW